MCATCSRVFTPRRQARESGNPYCSRSCSNRARKRPMSERFHDFYKPLPDPDACWPWTGPRDRDGYGVIADENRRQIRAHRLAYELLKGPIPGRHQIRHACDNPPCCNPGHLLTGSGADNMQDKVLRSRQAKGDTIRSTPLTAEKVRSIKEAIRAGATNTELAKRYGVTDGAIWFIRRGVTWKHVK